MFIKINPDSLRVALQALSSLYSVDCPLYYSVENGRILLESAGGVHRFNISFDTVGTDTLPLQSTTVGAFVQNLSLLNEYPDLLLTEAAITDEGVFNTYALLVTKQCKVGKNEPSECLTLSKALSVTAITDKERDSIKESRASYKGERLFICPASISVAANKAHILHADTLFLRGKQVYCASGDGVCRVATPELDDSLEQNIDAGFTFNISKLNAEAYDFYEDFVSFQVHDVNFKIGIPQKAAVQQLSQKVLSLFNVVLPEVRIYCKEVRTLHGKGPMRICSDKSLFLINDSIKLGAPFILPLVDNVQTVTVSDTVSKAAGDVWTVGTSMYNNRIVALVSGECDVMFNANI